MAARDPAVAGTFYPGEAGALLAAVDECLAAAGPIAPAPAIAAVLPHAGYVYSGPTVGAVAAAVRVPERVIALGPKHTRAGARVAVAAATAWRFPFGEVPIDAALAAALAAQAPLARDDAAHAHEHSIEVAVPFLWRRNPALRIAPVAVGHLALDELRAIGAAVAAAVRGAAGPVLIAASTDLSHQVPLAEARRLDGLALERILALDAEGLYRTVAENDISMCGVMPVTAALFAARELGAASARLVRYATSAEASGDERRVVGYAGVAIG